MSDERRIVGSGTIGGREVPRTGTMIIWSKVVDEPEPEPDLEPDAEEPETEPAGGGGTL